MEEKERYEVIVNKKNFIEIQDTESTADTFITEDNIEDWLNQKDKQIKEFEQEIQQLKQQLAEKEKEIEQITSKLPASYEKGQNQKAIEQLEKIINLFEPYENENKDTILCANNGISFLEYIDQQINELKGNVEDDKTRTRKSH